MKLFVLCFFISSATIVQGMKNQDLPQIIVSDPNGQLVEWIDPSENNKSSTPEIVNIYKYSYTHEKYKDDAYPPKFFSMAGVKSSGKASLRSDRVDGTGFICTINGIDIPVSKKISPYFLASCAWEHFSGRRVGELIVVDNNNKVYAIASRPSIDYEKIEPKKATVFTECGELTGDHVVTYRDATISFSKDNNFIFYKKKGELRSERVTAREFTKKNLSISDDDLLKIQKMPEGKKFELRVENPYTGKIVCYVVNKVEYKRTDKSSAGPEMPKNQNAKPSYLRPLVPLFLIFGTGAFLYYLFARLSSVKGDVTCNADVSHSVEPV